MWSTREATGHQQLLSTWNVAPKAELLNVKVYLILIHFTCKLQSHMWLVAPILNSTGLNLQLRIWQKGPFQLEPLNKSSDLKVYPFSQQHQHCLRTLLDLQAFGSHATPSETNSGDEAKQSVFLQSLCVSDAPSHLRTSYLI